MYENFRLAYGQVEGSLGRQLVPKLLSGNALVKGSKPDDTRGQAAATVVNPYWARVCEAFRYWLY